MMKKARSRSLLYYVYQYHTNTNTGTRQTNTRAHQSQTCPALHALGIVLILLLFAALCCSLLLFGTPFHAHPRPPASNLHEQRARHMISMISIEVQRIPLSLAFFPPPSLFVLGPLVRADSLLLRLFPSFLRLTSNLFSSPLNPLFSSRHLPFCILIQK